MRVLLLAMVWPPCRLGRPDRRKPHHCPGIIDSPHQGRVGFPSQHLSSHNNERTGVSRDPRQEHQPQRSSSQAHVACVPGLTKSLAGVLQCWTRADHIIVIIYWANRVWVFGSRQPPTLCFLTLRCAPPRCARLQNPLYAGSSVLIRVCEHAAR